MILLAGAIVQAPHVAEAAAAATALHFATDSNDRGGLAPGARAVLQQAFARLGLEVQFDPLPLRRSLRMIEQGLLDGESLRIAAVAEQRPQLLLVPVAISWVEVCVFVLDPVLKPSDWAALRFRRIAHQRGIVLLEELLADVPQRVVVTTPDDVLRKLRLSLVDVGLLTLASGQPPLPEAQLAGLHKVAGLLPTTPLYPLLHRRHAELLPQLTSVLNAMETSGESTRLRIKAWAQKPSP